MYHLSKTKSLTIYLGDSSEWHDENGDQEVRQRQTEDEVISHGLKVSVQKYCHHNKNIS